MLYIIDISSWSNKYIYTHVVFSQSAYFFIFMQISFIEQKILIR